MGGTQSTMSRKRLCIQSTIDIDMAARAARTVCSRADGLDGSAELRTLLDPAQDWPRDCCSPECIARFVNSQPVGGVPFALPGSFG